VFFIPTGHDEYNQNNQEGTDQQCQYVLGDGNVKWTHLFAISRLGDHLARVLAIGGQVKSFIDMTVMQLGGRKRLEPPFRCFDNNQQGYFYMGMTDGGDVPGVGIVDV